MEQLDSCYKKFKDGEISKNDFKNKVLEIVFNEKRYFGLAGISSDAITEILIRLNNYIDKIILKYNPEKGSISTYLCYIVKTLKKNQFIKEIKQKSYNDAVKNYEIESYQFSLMEKTPSYYGEKQEISREFKNLIYGNKITKISDKTKLLILIIKTCNYLNDIQLEEISKECNIPLKEIDYVVSQGKKNIEKKLEKIRIKNFTKSRLYILKNRYINQLEYLQKDCFYYQQVQESLKKAEEKWKIVNSNQDNKSIFPSNASIGKILNIPYHTVNSFFRCIYKNYGKNKEKELS